MAWNEAREFFKILGSWTTLESGQAEKGSWTIPALEFEIYGGIFLTINVKFTYFHWIFFFSKKSGEKMNILFLFFLLSEIQNLPSQG